MRPLRLVLWFACVLSLLAQTQLAPAQTPQTPVGTDAPDKGRWTELDVPVDFVNEAREAAGHRPLRPKRGSDTVPLRYQKPIEREWSFQAEIRSAVGALGLLPAARSRKTTDGAQVISGIDYDENGSLSGSFNIPADPHGAVGMKYVCHVVNVSIQCHDKGDGSSVLKQSLDDFFSHDSGNDLFDPRVVYDSRADRFVVLVLNKVDDGTAANNASEIFLAASDGDDPTGTWHRQTIDVQQVIESTECWFDYPGLALDEEAIYVTGTYFPFESESSSGACDTYLAIFDQGLYSGGSSTLEYLDDPNDDLAEGDFDQTLQPAPIFGTTPDSKVGTWMFQYSGLTDGTNEFWLLTRVDHPLDNASRAFASNLVSLGDVDDTQTDMPNAPQPDIADKIETNDRRALDFVWRDDRLWGTTTLVPPAGETNEGQATAHYGQIDVSVLGQPTPVSNNYIGGEDIETGAHTYFPSVTVDGSGNAGFGFSLSGANTYAGAYFVARPSSGSLSNTKIARSGVDSYSRNFGDGQNRWGDYSAVEVDPADGAVWTINKVALSEEEGCTSDCGRWGTFLTQFSSSVLPVDLRAFEGTTDGHTAVLTWETGSETTNAGFRVEHRGPERSSWTEEAFLEGSGSTTEPQRYRHRVANLEAGLHQFRLVQVDQDGTTALKGPVEVAIRPQAQYVLRGPHPNPTTNEARIHLAVRKMQPVRIALYNTLGQKVRTLDRVSVRPTSPLSIPVDGSSLASGLYFLRVEGERFAATRKLTIAQ